LLEHARESRNAAIGDELFSEDDACYYALPAMFIYLAHSSVAGSVWFGRR
jgi:hypothetical protein